MLLLVLKGSLNSHSYEYMNLCSGDYNVLPFCWCVSEDLRITLTAIPLSENIVSDASGNDVMMDIWDLFGYV